MATPLFKRSLALAALFVATGCVADERSGQSVDWAAESDLRPDHAQMNDVSVLLPLPASAEALSARLSAGDEARGGELLPRAVYEEAFGAPGTLLAGGTPAAPPHDALRLVAFRLDPCFAHLGPVTAESSCENQLRLIFQTFSPSGDSVLADAVLADDNAVHAFYALTREELTEAVEAMIALRLEHRGEERLGPLGPHPLAGDADQALRGLVTAHAGAENLTRLTVFTTSALGSAWNFSGFDVKDGATALTIPNTPAGTKVVAFFKGFAEGKLNGEPPFSPASSAPGEDNMQLLGNGDWAERAEVAARQRAHDAAVRIENPDVHTPESTDCASCHAAQPARMLVGEDMLSLSPLPESDFYPDERFVPVADLAETSIAGGVNVHMFSYEGTTASIHRRTIQETAAVVAFLNEQVLERP